jgi:hypothetical protein
VLKQAARVAISAHITKLCNEVCIAYTHNSHFQYIHNAIATTQLLRSNNTVICANHTLHVHNRTYRYEDMHTQSLCATTKTCNAKCTPQLVVQVHRSCPTLCIVLALCAYTAPLQESTDPTWLNNHEEDIPFFRTFLNTQVTAV